MWCGKVNNDDNNNNDSNNKINNNNNNNKSSVICSHLALLLSQVSKNKKNSFKKKFLYFWEMEFSGSNIKKFLIFPQKLSFHVFEETEISKRNFLYFRKRKP